jgi:hypothetical protein
LLMTATVVAVTRISTRCGRAPTFRRADASDFISLRSEDVTRLGRSAVKSDIQGIDSARAVSDFIQDVLVVLRHCHAVNEQCSFGS